MNFRLVATETRRSNRGSLYPYIVWIGEFDGLQHEHDEAVEFVRQQVGAQCKIEIELFPTILH